MAEKTLANVSLSQHFKVLVSFLTCLPFYIVVGLYSGSVVKFSCCPAKRFMVQTPAWFFWVGFVCLSSLWVLRHWEEGRSSNIQRAEVKLSVKQQCKKRLLQPLSVIFSPSPWTHLLLSFLLRLTFSAHCDPAYTWCHSWSDPHPAKVLTSLLHG